MNNLSLSLILLQEIDNWFGLNRWVAALLSSGDKLAPILLHPIFIVIIGFAPRAQVWTYRIGEQRQDKVSWVGFCSHISNHIIYHLSYKSYILDCGRRKLSAQLVWSHQMGGSWSPPESWETRRWGFAPIFIGVGGFCSHIYWYHWLCSARRKFRLYSSEP